MLYRVRKSWSDAKSQLGAYTVLANAKKVADKNKGYKVFDEKGKLVYPVPKTNPKMDKLIEACKTQATWMYKSNYKWEQPPTIAKSKNRGTCVTYVACVLQRVGALKSGQWTYFQNGKVYGTTKDMQVIYCKQKRPAALKSVLKKGDIVMHNDTKAGHIEIYAGSINSSGKAKYYTGGTGSGHNTSTAYWNSRPIFAIVRLKSYQ